MDKKSYKSYSIKQNKSCHNNSSSNNLDNCSTKKCKKSKHNCSSSSSSSSSDDDCNKKCKNKCKGPPGPLVATVMATAEPCGLQPNEENIYCLLPNCNNIYITSGCYITIACSSENTPYFLVISISDNVVRIKNINQTDATWIVGASVALIGQIGITGATGATLFDIADVAEISWPKGATLINEEGLIYLQLAPADPVNPGLLTSEGTVQYIGGDKFFEGVIVAPPFSGPPVSSWGGTYQTGALYFDTTLNALQLNVGATIGSVYGSTWTTLLTAIGSTASGPTGSSFLGVTALGATGLSYGATLTSDNYLQLTDSIAGGTNNTPGLMPGSYSDIFSTQGGDLSNFGKNWTQVNNYASYWKSIAMSSSGQYQTACIDFAGSTLYISNDYGVTWNPSGSPFAWKSVSVSSSGQYQTSIAYDGDYSYIYVSNNYGVSWELRNTTNVTLTCVSISASGQYQSISSNDVNDFILISNDYGIIWSSADTTTDGNSFKCIALSSSGQYQTACSINGVSNYIHTSTDFGNTWVVNSFEPISGVISAVSLSSSGQYQSVCTSSGGVVYISSDYGNTWRLSDYSPSNANLVSISVSASGQYQVVAQQSNGSYTGCIFTSSDFGNSWNLNNNAPIDLNTAPWSCVAISSSGQYITGALSGLYIWSCRNSLSNGVVNVGNYTTTSGVTGDTGSLYYDTTISGASGLQVSDGTSWLSVKSFVIDHPKNSKKYLVHACLEGPEAGVYYRGKSEIIDDTSVTIELPHYVSDIATNLTVQLTPIYDGNINKPPYFATEISDNKFSVYGVNGKFHWTVMGERLSLEAEPNKNQVQVKGDGPYKWI